MCVVLYLGAGVRSVECVCAPCTYAHSRYDGTYKSTRETVTHIATVMGVKFNPWSTLSHVIGGMEKRFVNAAIAAIGNIPGNRGTGGRIFDGFNMERRDGDTDESLSQL